MGKKINIGKSKNIDASTNIENSEIQAEALQNLTDLDLKVDEADDVNASTNIKGVKSQKGIVIILVALIAALVSIAGYYFTQKPSEIKKEEIIIEQPIDSTINVENNIQDSI